MVCGMTRTFIAFAALIASVPAVAAERNYSVTDFERVVVEGPYIVRVTIGRHTSARATGSQASLDRAQIDVSGQTLRIRRNRSYWGGASGAQEGPLTIELVTPNLRAARLIGPANLDVDGAEGLRLDLVVEGTGRLRATNIAADNLSLGLAGSGRIELAGTAKSLTADIQGAGDLVAGDLRADSATVAASTSGSIALEVVRTATITALGIGPVEITGAGDCVVRGPSADMVRCASDQR